MTDTELRDNFPFKANRSITKRRSSLGMTAGTAAALGALAGCGSGDGGGGGTAAAGDGTFSNGEFTGNAGNNVIDEAPRGAHLMAVGAGAGNDTVTTGAGSRVITGGAGDDTIDGGAGDDTAVYAGERDGFEITASIAAGTSAVTRATVTDTATTGTDATDEGTDTLMGVEELRFCGEGDQVSVGLVLGSNAENTDLTGGGNDDYIFGFAANDTATGGAGNDIIIGGAGDDTIHGNSATVLGADGGMDTAVHEGAFAGYTIRSSRTRSTPETRR